MTIQILVMSVQGELFQECMNENEDQRINGAIISKINDCFKVVA